MRRIFQIPVLILLYLLITAKSCDNQERADETRDEKRLKLAQDSIKSSFESDTLSNTSLRAFEVTAKIKLSDFNDYLTIFHDTSVAETFREKAREMIMQLFLSETSVLYFTKPDNSGRREISIRQLLQPKKDGSATFGKIISDSIRVEQSLQRAGDSVYCGKLHYSYIPSGQRSVINFKGTAAAGTIDFTVIKHEKNFGKDTLRIWDVFLGNLE